MLKRIIMIPLAILFLSMAFQSVSAQNSQSASPCASNPKSRQFDFWIGEWEVTQNGKKAGTNSVQRILGQCVIFENWTSASGGQGKSFNFYNRQIDKWQQIWVDDNGFVLQLTGTFTDGAMRFTGETKGRDGGKVMQKLTFFPLENDRVRQFWEQSTDNGTTWTPVFDGLYVKKN